MMLKELGKMLSEARKRADSTLRQRASRLEQTLWEQVEVHERVSRARIEEHRRELYHLEERHERELRRADVAACVLRRDTDLALRAARVRDVSLELLEERLRSNEQRAIEESAGEAELQKEREAAATREAGLALRINELTARETVLCQHVDDPKAQNAGLILAHEQALEGQQEERRASTVLRMQVATLEQDATEAAARCGELEHQLAALRSHTSTLARSRAVPSPLNSNAAKVRALPQTDIIDGPTVAESLSQCRAHRIDPTGPTSPHHMEIRRVLEYVPRKAGICGAEIQEQANGTVLPVQLFPDAQSHEADGVLQRTCSPAVLSSAGTQPCMGNTTGDTARNSEEMLIFADNKTLPCESAPHLDGIGTPTATRPPYTVPRGSPTRSPRSRGGVASHSSAGSARVRIQSPWQRRPRNSAQPSAG